MPAQHQCWEHTAAEDRLEELYMPLDPFAAALCYGPDFAARPVGPREVREERQP